MCSVIKLPDELKESIMHALFLSHGLSVISEGMYIAQHDYLLTDSTLSPHKNTFASCTWTMAKTFSDIIIKSACFHNVLPSIKILCEPCIYLLLIWLFTEGAVGQLRPELVAYISSCVHFEFNPIVIVL